MTFLLFQGGYSSSLMSLAGSWKSSAPFSETRYDYVRAVKISYEPDLEIAACRYLQYDCNLMIISLTCYLLKKRTCNFGNVVMMKN